MHYPLHITVLCTTLWILRDDAYAAKTGFNAEVLTSFAKNVASILSTTLLGEYQDQSANQLSSTLLKKIQDDPSLLNGESIDDPGSETSKSSSSRQVRHARSSKEVKGAFQERYVTPHQSGHSKYYNEESYEYAVNPDARISNDGKSSKNVNVDTKGNSIDADINAASVYYSDRHEHSPGLRITSNPVNPLSSNPYGHPAFQPRYHHPTPQSIEGSTSVNDAARITRRPYNLNYHAYFHPHRASFDRHPGFYSYGRPIEGNGQPSPSASGQDESNPSRLIDDQNQGQTALGGYDYSPHFHYKPPYYGGFYHGGFPAFPFEHRNGSYDHGNVEQPGGNSTAGFVPYGPPIFPDYKFNPYFPYHSTFPPYFNGHRRPADPQNPPDNAQNGEQSVSAENGQADANGTMGHRPPYGFLPYGPVYGDFYLPKYPLTFNGYPYHFNHGFHNFFPYFKPGPYFPLFHSYPYFGPYYRPHYNGRGHMTADKQMQPEKMGGNAEPPPTNDQAEMISESKADIVRFEKYASSWPFGKEIKKISDQLEEKS